MNPQIPTKLFVDMKSFKKNVEVVRRIMLENLNLLNAYLKINLKGEILI
jgi:hypothetical protein